MVIVLSNSYFYLANATMSQNTAVYDSSIIYASNSREPFEQDYSGKKILSD